MRTHLDPNTPLSELTLADLQAIIEAAVTKALAERFDDWDSALTTALLSEPVLAEDWNSPEEREAWTDLQKAILS
ncbi:MAG: hypothetical protein RMN52_10520 [Anaerolineae bacterium]|nr:hypothetical protein [Candidatus Roseilinea sp.]MDW8450429.1 hypothetical protein [Anaerolineae bacterium]